MFYTRSVTSKSGRVQKNQNILWKKNTLFHVHPVVSGDSQLARGLAGHAPGSWIWLSQPLSKTEMITLNAERKTWHKILFWCISSLNPCLLMTKSISEKVTEIVLHLMISSFHLCLLHDVNKTTYIKTSRFQGLSTKVMGQIWVFSEDAREEEAQCKDMLSYIFKSTVFFSFFLKITLISFSSKKSWSIGVPPWP